MRLVVISDTHMLHERVVIPPGDVLIHCGDITNRGKLAELETFSQWWNALPHPNKLIVPGNHDYCFDHHYGWETSIKAKVMLSGSKVLIDQPEIIGEWLFYGSPWVLPMSDWAFMKDERVLKQIYNKIPKWDSKIILITHGPPFMILDQGSHNEHLGSKSLRDAVFALEPSHHLFGHVHESYGIFKDPRFRTKFVNSAQWNYTDNTMNGAMVIDLED